VKANLGCGFGFKSGQDGVWALVCDHTGHVRAACCMTQQGFLPSTAAEAQAALMAIQLCMEMGFSQIHLEGNAKNG
jgi:hypothetical protein